MAAKSFYESVKQAYVLVARKEFGISGKEATTSRIAILTGLTRKEVQALLDMPVNREGRYEDEYNRAARVITGWLRDPDFGDGKGHPSPLRMAGKRLSFGALVKRYSGDIPVRAMLDELIRVGSARNSLVGIEHLTDEELEDLRTKCEARAKTEKSGEETVKTTGRKARRAAERAVD